MRASAVGVLCTLLLGCTPAVAVSHRCYVEVAPALLVEPEPRWGSPLVPASGILGDRVVITWISSGAIGEDMWQSRWLGWWDAELGGVSEPEYVAYTLDGGNLEFREVDGELIAQSWLSTEVPNIATFDEGAGMGFLVTSPERGTRFEPVLVRAQSAVSPTVLIGGGAEGLMPTLVTETDVVGAFISAPFECATGGGGLSTHHRATFASRSARRATPLFWGPRPCDGTPENGIAVANVGGAVLTSGEIALFVRLGTAGGRPPDNDRGLHYLRLRPDAMEIVLGPLRIGGIDTATRFDSGLQPRVLPFANERILFTERRGRDGLNTCHALRLVNDDGTDPTDAPWQLPCISDLERETRMVMLVPLEDGALVMWEERERIAFGERLLPDQPYDEGIFVATVNDGGQRTSEILRVTGPESRSYGELPATGGLPSNFRPHVSSNGERDAVVTWTSAHPDHLGAYAARIRCEPL